MSGLPCSGEGASRTGLDAAHLFYARASSSESPKAMATPLP